MKKRFLLTSICVIALGAALAFAGCGSSDASSDKTIKVGASPTPHAEILLDVVKPALEKKGYNLEVVEFDDYVLPNTALAHGEIDANYFQHQPYLDNFNQENDTDIVSVAAVHFEPFSIYAGKCKTLDELHQKINNGEKVIISVPNDTTNEARALLVLAANNIIKLPENADLNVTAIDIIDKADNIEIREIEAAQLARSLEDVDIACINGNYAKEAGLNVDDALAVEDVESIAAQTYANVVAVNAANKDSDATKALVEAITSDEVRQYIEDHYGNAVLAVF